MYNPESNGNRIPAPIVYSRTGTGRHDTQIVVTGENLILGKRRPCTDEAIITECFVPAVIYEETDEKGMTSTSQQCDFTTPATILHRIQNFAGLVPSIASYTVSMEDIVFDCIKKFPAAMFPTETGYGWLHFTLYAKKSKEENRGKPVIINEVADHLFVEELTDKIEFTFNQPNKINFSTKDMKVFPVFFQAGVAIAIANATKATLWLTVSDVQRMFCGITSQNELNNLIYNVFPLFPIFNAMINDKEATTFLKNVGGLKSTLAKLGHEKLMLKFEYNFSNTKDVKVTVLGKGQTPIE